MTVERLAFICLCSPSAPPCPPSTLALTWKFPNQILSPPLNLSPRSRSQYGDWVKAVDRGISVDYQSPSKEASSKDNQNHSTQFTEQQEDPAQNLRESTSKEDSQARGSNEPALHKRQILAMVEFSTSAVQGEKEVQPSVETGVEQQALMQIEEADTIGEQHQSSPINQQMVEFKHPENLTLTLRKTWRRKAVKDGRLIRSSTSMETEPMQMGQKRPQPEEQFVAGTICAGFLCPGKDSSSEQPSVHVLQGRLEHLFSRSVVASFAQSTPDQPGRKPLCYLWQD
ncbi:acetylglutamate kinase [Striga asiatica]|uniref:Acetylglutamate kinase n=1 Tax=Striga asiatica TaxID=4170 RepID=A0A5A7Q6F3_STRAF|nr:acetylglutamate kinase [Striga asiatica]